MELIIILVLISIASSVFQAINQEKGKAAKGAKPPLKAPVSPNINSPVITVVKPNQPRPQKRQVVKPVAENQAEAPAMSAFDYISSSEGVQREGSASVLPKLQTEINAEEENSILGDIGLNDLQKSIIMAEVLGKPKALKGFTR